MKSEGCGYYFLFFFFVILILKIPVQLTYRAVADSGVTIQWLGASIRHSAPSTSSLLHPQPLFYPQLPTPSQPGSRLFALYWYSFIGVTHLLQFGCDPVENIYRLKNLWTRWISGNVMVVATGDSGTEFRSASWELCDLKWGPSGAGCCSLICPTGGKLVSCGSVGQIVRRLLWGTACPLADAPGLSVPLMDGSRTGEAASLYTSGMTLEEESTQNIGYPSEFLFRISQKIARNHKFLKTKNDPNVNSGLELTIMHQYWFISGNNCTTLIPCQ